MTDNNLPNSTRDLPNEYLVRLEDRAALRLTGQDTTKYLQGQLTHDVNKMSNRQALLACHCEFKGKTWDIYTIASDDKSTVLIGHQGALEKSLEQLKKYAVFSQVDINSADDYVLFGGSGESVEKWIGRHFGQLPDKNLAMISSHQEIVIRLDSPHIRYMLMLQSKSAETLIEDACPLFPTSLWNLMDIQAGIPSLNADTSGEFVPQMMNMQALDAISFTKGCYMGQEVVARTKFLGKNKRAAFILKAQEHCEMNPGDLLEKQVGENWRRGGTVLSCVALGKETWILAVLSTETQADEILRSKNRPDACFTVQTLPYSLEVEEDKSTLN
ncbi:tRNA-modifying protein YgfZ [Lacimicrobium alkaliphilum]|uniref:tRNA-modifying protein YgfZ n=1 Tax=Lacimicrobium alkaliphilum TaxID=1526571 RepID=A0ABQ1RHX6_9ALTE|nr:tRNA-modifying protein YgfZ [Lacimicrobium alkaliphilum]GGD67648.1 tRNA-modifying protein YgfZ [Lacimicrobium alkaliphilum]